MHKHTNLLQMHQHDAMPIMKLSSVFGTKSVETLT